MCWCLSLSLFMLCSQTFSQFAYELMIVLTLLGSARTSLIITIGPSSQYHAETASTIMFGQRVSWICYCFFSFFPMLSSLVF